MYPESKYNLICCESTLSAAVLQLFCLFFGFSRCQKTKVVQRKVRTLQPFSSIKPTEGSRTAFAPGPGRLKKNKTTKDDSVDTVY